MRINMYGVSVLLGGILSAVFLKRQKELSINLHYNIQAYPQQKLQACTLTSDYPTLSTENISKRLNTLTGFFMNRYNRVSSTILVSPKLFKLI